MHFTGGLQQSGHQRYKCKSCNKVFTFRRKDISEKNRFVWFEWWVLGKQIIEQISAMSGYDYITLNVPPVALSIVPLQKMSLSVRQSYDYF